MNSFRFNTFLEEFSFLAETLKGKKWGDCDSITIKRATKELLNQVPRYKGATGSLVSIDIGERIDFVFGETVLRDTVKSSGFITHNEAYQDDESWEGETILEGIYRRGVAEKLQYIVSFQYGYNVQNHRSLSNFNITIYKPNREFTWSEVIEEAEARAKNEVLAEAEF